MTDIELCARADAVACYPAITYAMKQCAPDLAAARAEIQAFYSLPGGLETLRRKGLLHRADYLPGLSVSRRFTG